MLQWCSKQNSKILAEKQTHRPMAQQQPPTQILMLVSPWGTSVETVKQVPLLYA